MISFKANYIDSTKIKRVNSSGISDKSVSFVEINPLNYNDQLNVNKVAIKWDKKGGRGLAYDICRSINNLHETNSYNKDDRFFAITTQRESFETLNPNEVLALTYVNKLDDKTNFVEYLQVDPKHLAKNRKAEFCEIGSAMLNSLKQLFRTKDIALDSKNSTVNFYVKNGFETEFDLVDKTNKVIGKHMKYKAVK